MTEGTPLTYEQSQAWKLLDLATTHITDDVTTRSAWLLTAVGAALTFVVSNAGSMSALIDARHIRMSLCFLTVSLLCGLAVQTLRSGATNALVAGRALLEIASTPHDPDAFLKSFTGGLSWPLRLRMQYEARRPNRDGFMALVYMPARVSQRQSAWCFMQLGFVIAAVFLLAIGVKV